MMSIPKYDRNDLSQHSFSAYVKAYQNSPDYKGILDQDVVDFLAYAALKWNSRMGCMMSLLISGVSFSFLSGARVEDSNGHRLPTNTYIISPAPPGMGKTAAYENILQTAWLELEQEIQTSEGRQVVGVLENTTKIALLEKLGDLNGKVFWCRDELTHHIYTHLSENKGADLHTFRSNLNILYTSNVFRRNTVKKRIVCDDVHFCIAGTGHPNHCLLLAHALDSEMDGLADRFYIFCGRATVDPEVKDAEGRVAGLTAQFGSVLKTNWAKDIYRMIYKHHEAQQTVYTLSDDASVIITRIRENNVNEITQAYERIERLYRERDNEEQETDMGFNQAFNEIPNNCDSKDTDMILKCSLIIKALRAGFQVVLGYQDEFKLTTTITEEDLMRGWSLVTMLRHHTSCFIQNARLWEATFQKGRWNSDGTLTGVLKEDFLKKGILLYPGRWMLSTYLARKYRTGQRSTQFGDIFRSFTEMTKKKGEPGFVGQYVDLGNRRHAFYKAPWSSCDRDCLQKQYKITEEQYKTMWGKSRSDRKIGLTLKNWNACEKLLKRNIPIDCRDPADPESDEENNPGTSEEHDSEPSLPLSQTPKRERGEEEKKELLESPTKQQKNNS